MKVGDIVEVPVKFKVTAIVTPKDGQPTAALRLAAQLPPEIYIPVPATPTKAKQKSAD